MPSFISRVRRCFAPLWGGLQTRLGAPAALAGEKDLDDDLGLCETIAKAGLIAPSTYKRIKLAMSGERTAWVTFDAANVYGTPIRHSVTCRFSGKLTSHNHRVEEVDMDGEPVNVEQVKLGLTIWILGD